MQVDGTLTKLHAGKSLYNPVSISNKQARLWRHKFTTNVTGDAIMNIAVSFSLRFG